MGWQNLKIFELQSGRDKYYARVPDEFTGYEAMGGLAVPTLVMYEHLTGLVIEDTLHERWLV